MHLQRDAAGQIPKDTPVTSKAQIDGNPGHPLRALLLPFLGLGPCEVWATRMPGTGTSVEQGR